MTMRHVLPIATLAAMLLLPGAFAAGGGQASKLVDHPSKLTYEKLNWQVPLGSPYRHALSNGLRAYIAADSSIPLITVVAYVKYGQMADPAGKEGEGYLYCRLLRSGGTQKYTADSLDALLDLLAMHASFSLGKTELQCTFSFLSEYRDTALSIIEQMLLHPAFDKARLQKEKEIAVQNIQHRFDNPGPALNAAYEKALYPAQANSRLTTEKSVSSVTRDELAALHKKVLRAGNILLGVSGKFDPVAMQRRLEAMFPAAPTDSSYAPFPQSACAPKCRALLVQKNINQSYVRLGIPLFKRPHPDYYPLSVLNMVFGGESFTSRLGSRIRSDEGLTYSIYSHVESNYVFPATFYVDFHTKTGNTIRVITLINEEIARICKDGVTAEELSDAKKSLVDVLPSNFRNVDDIVEQYAWNEYYGRPDDQYRSYPAKIEAITQQEVLDVARKYLQNAQFTYAIVADTAALFVVDTSSAFSLRKLNPTTVPVADSLASRP